MRILFATYSMAFQNPGGGERVIIELKNALKTLGHHVDLYNPWCHRPADYDVIHYFSTIERSMWATLKRLAPHRPLCVTPVLHLPSHIEGAFHLLKLYLSDSFLRQTGQNPGFISSFSVPNLFFPITEIEAGHLTKKFHVSPEKLALIPNGVSPHFINSNPELFRKKFQLVGPFFLQVARFDPVKNHLKSIEAISRLRGHGVFIGSPDLGKELYYQKCLEAARKAEVADPTGNTKFTFLSAIPNEDPILASAYAAASAVLVPSHFETFGISALEAALTGTPVVLSKNLMSRSLFKDFGIFVDPMNPKEIADAAEKSARQGRLPQELCQKILDQFSWKNIGKRLEQAYKHSIQLTTGGE